MIARFRSALIFEDDSGFPYTLMAPLVYDCCLLAQTIIVPAGFRTDLASIPRGLWNLLPKSGAYDRAAVIHDALYAWGKTALIGGVSVTRAEADGVLKEAMQVLGVGRVTRWLIVSGVRLGGFAPWGAYRRQALERV